MAKKKTSILDRYKPKKPFSISLPSRVKELAQKKVNREGWKSFSTYVEHLIKKDNGE